MDAIPTNLCTLVEQLEDSRRFHHAAAQQSTGDRRQRHHERSRAYAAMLSEISAWESRVGRRARQQAPGAHGAESKPNPHDDGYAALLERVYRIHRTTASPVRPVTLKLSRAIGNATDGGARDGHRRAGVNAPD